MYTEINFKSKKEIKTAIASGERLTVYQPNNIFNAPPVLDGTVYLEGPHYPKPHKWYAQGKMENGYLISIK